MDGTQPELLAASKPAQERQRERNLRLTRLLWGLMAVTVLYAVSGLDWDFGTSGPAFVSLSGKPSEREVLEQLAGKTVYLRRPDGSVENVLLRRENISSLTGARHDASIQLRFRLSGERECMVSGTLEYFGDSENSEGYSERFGGFIGSGVTTH